MDIKNIHYGLTLLYSYYLPLFNITETSWGFIFEKVFGSAKGLRCSFKESELLTECIIPNDISKEEVIKLLGLDKSSLFKDLCRVVNLKNCITSNVTLIHDEKDARYVFYAIYLSRNTDYHINTVKWARQAIVEGHLNSTSYIAMEFNEVKGAIDGVFNDFNKQEELIENLLSVRGVSVKSVAALLLHAYGLTSYAPIDRHYASYLGNRLSKPAKVMCARLKLNCKLCSRNCVYKYALKKYGIYNGILQSAIYIYVRLRSKRRSEIEKVLIKDPSDYLDETEDLLVSACFMDIKSNDKSS